VVLVRACGVGGRCFRSAARRHAAGRRLLLSRASSVVTFRCPTLTAWSGCRWCLLGLGARGLPLREVSRCAKPSSTNDHGGHTDGEDNNSDDASPLSAHNCAPPRCRFRYRPEAVVTPTVRQHGPESRLFCAI
jgi:hypothetical protein